MQNVPNKKFIVLNIYAVLVHVKSAAPTPGCQSSLAYPLCMHLTDESFLSVPGDQTYRGLLLYLCLINRILHYHAPKYRSSGPGNLEMRRIHNVEHLSEKKNLVMNKEIKNICM